MSTCTYLLLSFAGLLVLNALLTGVLWLRYRTALHRAQVLFWLALIFTSVLQAFVVSDRAMIFAYGFGGLFVHLLLVDVLRRALDLKFAARLYAVSFALGLVGSLITTWAGAPFWAAALPITVGATVSPLHLVLQALPVRRRLSLTGQAAVFGTALLTLHDLDYPFLRDDPRFAAAGFVAGFLVVFALSITAPAIIIERTKAQVTWLQEELVRRERLSALGEAAAVVAHEVRNPLAVLTNTIQMLRREPSLSRPGAELLTLQESEVLRLDRLVQDLLGFTRPDAARLQRVDLGESVLGAVETLRPLAHESRVSLELAAGGSALIHADPDQLHQAFTNVLRNAIEASPPHGTVRVALRAEAEAAHVSVSDEGAGVEPEELPRLFEPFFTTRARGCGLGLAVVSRVMQTHRGAVHVTNLPTGGAQFELVLPLGAATGLERAGHSAA